MNLYNRKGVKTSMSELWEVFLVSIRTGRALEIIGKAMNDAGFPPKISRTLTGKAAKASWNRGRENGKHNCGMAFEAYRATSQAEDYRGCIRVLTCPCYEHVTPQIRQALIEAGLFIRKIR